MSLGHPENAPRSLLFGGEEDETGFFHPQLRFAVYLLSDVTDSSSPSHHKALRDVLLLLQPDFFMKDARGGHDASLTAQGGPGAEIIDGARSENERAPLCELGQGQGAQSARLARPRPAGNTDERGTREQGEELAAGEGRR